MSAPSFRRRIDRITNPDYLAGIEDQPAATLRAMRDECREEEAELSYVRRVLHGKLDILAAERERRAFGEAPSQLVDRLSSILADRAPSRRAPTGSTGIYEPRAGGRRRSDHVVDELPLATVPDLGDDELDALTDDLRAEERRVSGLRAVALEAFDALQAELVSRYRSDAGALDEVVGSSDPDR